MSGTLWSSVVKDEGTGSIEKARGAADTLERAKDTVHATDGGIKQQHGKDGQARTPQLAPTLPTQLPVIRSSPTL